MLTSITDTITQYLPSKRKTSSSGWISFKAPCCTHRGESADTRGRGGIIINPTGGISYHCFNCNFTANYTPGYHLNYKFRKLLSWLGVDENGIRRLVIDALRVKELIAPGQIETQPKQEISFSPRALPPGSVNILESRDESATTYILGRGLDPAQTTFYTSNSTAHNMNRRVIIPFTWQNELIGYTSRSWDPTVKPKYHNSYDNNFVFNVDNQQKDWKFVIVCEGPFDALSIGGVAILSNECSEIQADIIEQLGREIILVPDADRAGTKLVDHAAEYGWTVSFPVWLETCKDINDAVIKYGKLFVLKSIIDARETSRLKIELRKRKLYH